MTAESELSPELKLLAGQGAAALECEEVSFGADDRSFGEALQEVG